MDQIILGDWELKNKKRWSSLFLSSSYWDMNKMRVKWLPERKEKNKRERQRNKLTMAKITERDSSTNEKFQHIPASLKSDKSEKKKIPWNSQKQDRAENKHNNSSNDNDCNDRNIS